ncbi:hypothetical protein Tco_0034819 [Tanacetum coccineum]
MSVRLLMSDWIGQSEPHYLLDLPVRHWISYPKIMVFTLTRDIRSGSRGAVLPDQNVYDPSAAMIRIEFKNEA